MLQIIVNHPSLLLWRPSVNKQCDYHCLPFGVQQKDQTIGDASVPLIIAFTIIAFTKALAVAMACLFHALRCVASRCRTFVVGRGGRWWWFRRMLVVVGSGPCACCRHPRTWSRESIPTVLSPRGVAIHSHRHLPLVSMACSMQLALSMAWPARLFSTHSHGFVHANCATHFPISGRCHGLAGLARYRWRWWSSTTFCVAMRPRWWPSSSACRSGPDIGCSMCQLVLAIRHQ